MAEIIPEEIEPPRITIKLDVGIPYYRTAWGVRYRWKGGIWNIVQVAFHKKSDAEDWMEFHITAIKPLGLVVEKEVIPVTSVLELTPEGNVNAWVEELS